MTKEKAKIGLETQRKEAALAKVEVIKVIKELTGHVTKWNTRPGKASVEVRVVPKGRARSGTMAKESGTRSGGWWRVVCGPSG